MKVNREGRPYRKRRKKEKGREKEATEGERKREIER
jgi:hypothetical protein